MQELGKSSGISVVNPGEKFRHYKGERVIVKAIAMAETTIRKGDPFILENVSPPDFQGQTFNATVGKIEIILEQPIPIATDDIELGEQVVLYRELNEEDEEYFATWARPLRIFEEILGKPTSQYYRFEPEL